MTFAILSPGLLAEQLLRLGVVDQDFVQVLLVQDEEVSEAVGDHVGRASVTAPYCQETVYKIRCLNRVNCFLIVFSSSHLGS